MAKYTIGIDFGTLSARALVTDVENGREMGSAVFDYPHGVMDETLPDGTKLNADWALQDPSDYLIALKNAVPKAVRNADIDKNDIIAYNKSVTNKFTAQTEGMRASITIKNTFN